MSEDGKATTRTPQHLEALARANRVRLARAGLKRAVAEGRVDVGAVVTGCPWEAETMSLAELLSCQRRWGRTRTRKFLSELGLGENKTVMSLTQRQRRMLSAALEQRALDAPVRAEAVERRRALAMV